MGPFGRPGWPPVHMVMSGGMPPGPPCHPPPPLEGPCAMGPFDRSGWPPAHMFMSGGMPPGPPCHPPPPLEGPCGVGRPSQHIFKKQTDGMAEELHGGLRKCMAAMWNLDPTYTEESLRADLWEVDFEPEEIVACGKNTGAFGLLFAEKYMATGLATALDGIDPEEKVVRSRGNSFFELVRVAEWEDEAIPDFVRTAMTQHWMAPVDADGMAFGGAANGPFSVTPRATHQHLKIPAPAMPIALHDLTPRVVLQSTLSCNGIATGGAMRGQTIAR